MRVAGVFVLCMALVGCSEPDISVGFPQAPPSAEAIIYRTANGDHEWIFDNGLMVIRMAEAASERVRTNDPLGADFIWDVDTTDCSNNMIACLEAERFTFAAPKGARAVGDRYVRGGLRFTVESCEGADCATVRIRADCDAFIDAQCVPVSDGLPVGTNPAMTTYIIHERSRGVTSLGTTYDQPLDADGSGMATEYRLVGPRGILVP